MLDIASFHSRLCDFAANVILDYNEMVRPAANTRSTVEEVKENSSMEQGDLFGSSPKAEEKPRETKPRKPVARPILKPQRKSLTYRDYLGIHCGNKAAANYWFMRNEGQPLS